MSSAMRYAVEEIPTEWPIFLFGSARDCWEECGRKPPRDVDLVMIYPDACRTEAGAIVRSLRAETSTPLRLDIVALSASEAESSSFLRLVSARRVAQTLDAWAGCGRVAVGGQPDQLR